MLTSSLSILRITSKSLHNLLIHCTYFSRAPILVSTKEILSYLTILHVFTKSRNVVYVSTFISLQAYRIDFKENTVSAHPTFSIAENCIEYLFTSSSSCFLVFMIILIIFEPTSRRLICL